MKIQQGLSNQPAFGQTNVKIKYKELKDMGSDVVELAEKIKSRLETRDSSVKYKIGRHYKIEGDTVDFPGLSIPTNKLYISAKKANQGLKAKLKDFFNVNFSAYKTTPTLSERSMMRIANKATSEVKNTKSESIFSLLGNLLTMEGPSPH